MLTTALALLGCATTSITGTVVAWLPIFQDEPRDSIINGLTVYVQKDTGEVVKARCVNHAECQRLLSLPRTGVRVKLLVRNGVIRKITIYG